MQLIVARRGLPLLMDGQLELLLRLLLIVLPGMGCATAVAVAVAAAYKYPAESITKHISSPPIHALR